MRSIVAGHQIHVHESTQTSGRQAVRIDGRRDKHCFYRQLSSIAVTTGTLPISLPCSSVT